MKRCIVCGNIGSDDSTICSECGNAFIEMDDETPDADMPEESLEQMEEQLKEMWARVQESEPAGTRKAAGDPDLTVISEEPEVLETEKAAVKSEAADAEPVPEAAAQSEAADAELPEAAAEESAEEKTQTETPMQSGKNADTQTEPSPQKAVDVEALMKAAAKKTADGEAGADDSTGKTASVSLDATAEANSKGQQAAQRTGHSQTRRTKGGPQIYGQESMAEYSGAQGVIRKDVQGGHAAAARTGSGNSAESGRSASRPPRRPAASPAEDGMGLQNTQSEIVGEVPVNAPGLQGNPAKQASQTQRMVPPYPQSPQGGQGHGQHGGKHSGTARRIMEAAQDALSSPLLIVIAVLQTVYFVSAVAAIFLRELNYEQGAKLLALLPLPSQISGYATMLQAALAQLDSGALVLNLLIRVPDLLFCIALWTLCITVRNAGEKMSGSGFLLMRISAILNMIASCAVFLVVLVVCVTFVIAAWNAGTTSLIIIAVVLLVLAIIVTMAVIMYFFCYLSTIKTIQKNALSGERYGSVSVYVAIVKLVIALTAIISLLSGIVNFEITGITTGIGQLGWMILFGVWILKYRSTLSEYEE